MRSRCSSHRRQEVSQNVDGCNATICRRQASGRLLKNNYMSLASKFYCRVYLLEIVSN
ncbi:hypothetical protein CFter6_1488 [Collimonas fungivorans]|uniref:Uncharacterized protein n=1 Tax=Collimonas fungivorans TaxID=158899 RepID=A0A127P9S8_9BURK|nr:hypothetical protein CFter6_1488 [Collimonas fungivorans]